MDINYFHNKILCGNPRKEKGKWNLLRQICPIKVLWEYLSRAQTLTLTDICHFSRFFSPITFSRKTNLEKFGLSFEIFKLLTQRLNSCCTNAHPSQLLNKFKKSFYLNLQIKEVILRIRSPGGTRVGRFHSAEKTLGSINGSHLFVFR